MLEMAQTHQDGKVLHDGHGPSPSLVPLLISIAKSTRQLMSLKLLEIGVIAGQDQFLDALDPVRPVSVKAVADGLSVRPSTVSKMLDHFEEKGWAAREADKSDMRKTFVRLTPLGTHLQHQVRTIWTQVEVDLTRGRGGEEMDEDTILGLTKIEDILSRRLSRLR